MQNPKSLELIVPFGVYVQMEHSSLASRECEIATNMINAKWRAAYSNYEHEMIAEKAGISADSAERLIGGRIARLRRSMPCGQFSRKPTCAIGIQPGRNLASVKKFDETGAAGRPTNRDEVFPTKAYG